MVCILKFLGNVYTPHTATHFSDFSWQSLAIRDSSIAYFVTNDFDNFIVNSKCRQYQKYFGFSVFFPPTPEGTFCVGAAIYVVGEKKSYTKSV